MEDLLAIDHRDTDLGMGTHLIMDMDITTTTIRITDGVDTGRGSGEAPLRSVRSFLPFQTMTVMIFMLMVNGIKNVMVCSLNRCIKVMM
jgi:hypothetical protein